jgi:hypothetical protein
MEDLFQVAMLLFDEIEIEQGIRLLGISCGQLKKQSDKLRQINLFQEGESSWNGSKR